MALGMASPTESIVPRVRPWATIEQGYSDLTGVDRWLNGVKFIPFGIDRTIGALADPCITRTRQADPTDRGAEITFYPFLVETSVDCTPMSLNEVALQSELEAFAKAHLAIERPPRVALQVMEGTYAGMNPWFANVATALTGADRTLVGALQAVERGLAALLGDAQGLIHVPSWLLSSMQLGGGLRFIDNIWYTASGHIVVADAGYRGPSPLTHGVTTGETWIYGSGPVKYVTSEPQIDGTQKRTDFDTHNDWDVYATQYALAIFEPGHVVAAAVTTSTDAPDLEQA